MFSTLTSFVLANQSGSGMMSNFFDNDGLGQLIQNFARWVAVLVVLMGFAAAGKNILGARVGAAARSIIGGLLLGALLFNLKLTGQFLDVAIDVASKLISSIAGAVGVGGGG